MSSKRVRQHLILGFVSAAATAVMFAVVRADDMVFRTSMATAYASLALLIFGIVLGPLNVLRGRPNPVSTNLRRDAGIWGGGLGLVHVLFGLNVHLRGRMLQYFVDPKRSESLVPVRLDAFGLANYTGLAAGLILVLLLALSNDLTLRRLGTRRWKTLQRANYVGMGLVVLHGIVYQLMEKRSIAFVALFASQVLLAVVLQLVGYRQVIRARRSAG